MNIRGAVHSRYRTEQKQFLPQSHHAKVDPNLREPPNTHHTEDGNLCGHRLLLLFVHFRVFTHLCCLAVPSSKRIQNYITCLKNSAPNPNRNTVNLLTPPNTCCILIQWPRVIKKWTPDNSLNLKIRFCLSFGYLNIWLNSNPMRSTLLLCIYTENYLLK